MPRSLLRTILELSQYEPRRCSSPPRFLTVQKGLLDNARVSRVVRAADNLIDNLFSYGKEINIGSRYFQPCFYRPLQLVSFDWTFYNCTAFCRGCPRSGWDCPNRRFSSECSRFGIAWAVTHITANTNRLIQLLICRKERRPQ